MCVHSNLPLQNCHSNCDSSPVCRKRQLHLARITETGYIELILIGLDLDSGFDESRKQSLLVMQIPLDKVTTISPMGVIARNLTPVSDHQVVGLISRYKCLISSNPVLYTESTSRLYLYCWMNLIVT